MFKPKYMVVLEHCWISSYLLMVLTWYSLLSCHPSTPYSADGFYMQHTAALLNQNPETMQTKTINLCALCFVLFNDTWSQEGHLMSCMTKLFFIFANHQIRHQDPSTKGLALSDCRWPLLIFLLSLCGYIQLKILTLSLQRMYSNGNHTH